MFVRRGGRTPTRRAEALPAGRQAWRRGEEAQGVRRSDGARLFSLLHFLVRHKKVDSLKNAEATSQIKVEEKNIHPTLDALNYHSILPTDK